MIEQRILVNASQQRAFEAFTEHVDEWWPTGHRQSGDPTGRLMIESGVGGRFFELTENGEEFDYGRVRSWEPPSFLSFDFYLGSSPEHSSLVDVTFTPVQQSTLIEIRHQPGEMSADHFEKIADRFVNGWAIVAESINRFLNRTVS